MKTWKYQRKSKIFKWWKKHQHAQRKTTSSYFGASTKTLRIHESMNQSIENRTPNKFPLHPAPSHLRKLRSTICQVAAALRSLSGWLLSKGSPLLHACNPQRKTDSELKSLCHPFLGENEESIAKLQSRTINQAHFSTKARAWVFLTTAALPLFASS